MSKCECGCGEKSAHEFLPGHDQKLRITLEDKVGGLLPMRSLLEAAESYANGQLDDQELLKQVRAAFASAWRRNA